MNDDILFGKSITEFGEYFTKLIEDGRVIKWDLEDGNGNFCVMGAAKKFFGCYKEYSILGTKSMGCRIYNDHAVNLNNYGHYKDARDELMTSLRELAMHMDEGENEHS